DQTDSDGSASIPHPRILGGGEWRARGILTPRARVRQADSAGVGRQPGTAGGRDRGVGEDGVLVRLGLHLQADAATTLVAAFALDVEVLAERPVADGPIGF